MSGSKIRIETLKQYINEDVNDTFSRYALALEYIKTGDFIPAKGEMEYLFKHHADYLPNYYHFGKLLEKEGNKQQAIQIYKAGIIIATSQNDHHTLNELNGALETCED